MENTNTTLANDAVLTQPKSSEQTLPKVEGLPPAKSPKWLVWTGVLGAFLALLALTVVMVLGQRLLQLEANQAQATQQTQQQLDSQYSQWQAEQQKLFEQQQTLSLGLRGELAELLTQVDARLKERQQHQSWQVTDVNIVKLMAAQLQGLSLLSVEPKGMLNFLDSWQSLLAQQGVEVGHPLRQALMQEAQALSRLSVEREALLDQQTWRVWQGLVDYYAPASADGLIKPTTEVSDTQEASWWQGFMKFIRITPAEKVDTSRLTQLRDATLWQTQASMALAQLRWGLQTNQPRLVQVESQQLAQLLAVMAVSVPEAMSAQLTTWQTWSGWSQPEWTHLGAYLAQTEVVKQP